MGVRIKIFFDQGSLLLREVTPEASAILPGIKWDDRVRIHRAPAHLYRQIVSVLHRRKIPYEDNARAFAAQDFILKETIKPRVYQKEAEKAWMEKGRRGVVVLPTGAGKTILAVMLIARICRDTIIYVPTIDLMHQWHDVLTRFFGNEIGLLGGGYNQPAAITVSTYDSGLLHVPHRGNAYGMVVFDECHRLPGERYQFLAMGAIAPFRLGLTATPERGDGRESVLYKLCGPLRFQVYITDLTGDALAPYEVVTLEVEMKPEERELYDEAYGQYVSFLRSENINLGSPRGWQQFLWKVSRSAEGRQALKAYQLQKRLSLASTAKYDKIWELLQIHHKDRILIFTQDNHTAYTIGRMFFLPVLTHQTRIKERESYLKAFSCGDYPVLVTSKVLNEGVDVPEANVAIVVSGSGSVREHVQRLGRILRGQPGKRAILYELISENTREFYVNQRRKRHHAYEESRAT